MIPDKFRKKLSHFMAVRPVSINDAARIFGLEVRSDKLPEGVSCFLFKDASYETDSEYVIFVDSVDPEERQRFAAAHALGHYLLHRDSIGSGIQENLFLEADGLSSEQETEANEFAMEFLMPMDSIMEVLYKETKSIEELAEIFNVTIVAMSNRLGMPT